MVKLGVISKMKIVLIIFIGIFKLVNNNFGTKGCLLGKGNVFKDELKLIVIFCFLCSIIGIWRNNCCNCRN